MTREEEIQIRAKQEYDWFGDTGDVKGAFISGAKWADQNPREGLWDSEKVTQWLKENFEQYAYNYGIDEVIVGLRKAMED